MLKLRLPEYIKIGHSLDPRLKNTFSEQHKFTLYEKNPDCIGRKIVQSLPGKLNK
jgi:hypothetical protein